MRYFDLTQSHHMESMINDDYHYKLYIDGLPVATIIRDPLTGDVHKDYFEGVPIGHYYLNPETGQSQHMLYNHWILTVKTSKVKDSLHRKIVGFEVEPRSYKVSPRSGDWVEGDPPLILEELDANWRDNSSDVDRLRINYTYTIKTVEDN